MTWLIVSLTLRQLLGQRRTWLLVLLALAPVLIAVIFRLTTDGVRDPREFVADGVMSNVMINLVLPLAALIFGTAALGQEFEDGTAPYLFAKPLARWRIAVAKVLAAWMGTAGVVGASVLATGVIALVGGTMDLIVPAFMVAAVLGALAYAALFVCLSVLFERALVIGLIYVFVWEALITSLAPGAAYLSVRAYTLGVARALADTPATIFSAQLGGAASFGALALVVLLTLGYAIRRLGSLEIARRA
ncbi:MAG: ABC transporter permease [Chloroflexi bacterium]|nr:ABC transporter permease [Chloroflexota bacterium]